MKFLVVFIHEEDAEPTAKILLGEGFRFTVLESTSGLLRAQTRTFLIGLEEERVEACLDAFRGVCRERRVGAPLSLLAGVEIEPGEFNPRHDPVTVRVGGAVGFLLEVGAEFRI